MDLKAKHRRGATILAVAVGAAFAVIYFKSEARRGSSSEIVAPVSISRSATVVTLSRLTYSASSNRPPNADIALMNLLCGESLKEGGENTVQNSLATLDQWATRVKAETERHLYRFRANPAEFENSEGYFRMLMMAVVLYEDFGVRYNPKLISQSSTGAADYDFFANQRDVFINGLLGSERTGTCSSMPVLYVALGRRLGYPLKLVTTKAHLFIRWEGNGERFNLEATGKGMNRYDDEHYKRWPFPVTEEEMRDDGYLKSLTSDEELALFLSIRGHCFMAASRFDEAAKSYSEATKLAPTARGYRLLFENASRLVQLAAKETL